MKIYIFGLIVIIWSCVYYDNKVKKMIDDSKIIFSSFGVKYNMIGFTILITFMFFLDDLDIYEVLAMCTINYWDLCKMRLVIHSDGVILKMKNYKYENIKFYKICVHSSKKFKLMLLIYDKDEKAYKNVYKNVVLRCEYRDEVINAFKGNVKGSAGAGCDN
ncbi:hypothetical protein [Tepidibacter sp. Z1-5]|uniref:hypothetical protein n=1 Tax=Tepidibacter sp. Z1-5 TaxID=3134138 RepID=UPI0030BBB45C